MYKEDVRNVLLRMLFEQKSDVKLSTYNYKNENVRKAKTINLIKID